MNPVTAPAVQFGWLGKKKKNKNSVGSSGPGNQSAPLDVIALKVAEANRQAAQKPEIQEALTHKGNLAGDVNLSGLDILNLIREAELKGDKSIPGHFGEQEAPAKLLEKLVPQLDEEMSASLLPLVDNLKTAGLIEFNKSSYQTQCETTPIGQAAVKEANHSISSQIPARVKEAYMQKARLPQYQRTLRSTCKLAGDVTLNGHEMLRLLDSVSNKPQYRYEGSAKEGESTIKPQLVKLLIPNLDKTMMQSVLGMLDTLEQAGFIKYEKLQGNQNNFSYNYSYHYFYSLTPIGEAAATQELQAESRPPEERTIAEA